MRPQCSCPEELCSAASRGLHNTQHLIKLRSPGAPGIPDLLSALNAGRGGLVGDQHDIIAQGAP